jgi:small-conductance mechanosensitive channel
MIMSRRRWIALLSASLLILIGFGAFGSWFAPLFGEAGVHLHQFLVRPFFTMGGLPVTLIFLVKVAIFFVMLLLASHFVMILLHKRILTHTPLEAGQQYAVARMVSYLVFILGTIIGLQSLGVNLNSLVVIGGALGIGVGLGLQAIVSNFVAGLVLLLEQPVKLGDRIEIGGTFGDVVRLRGRSTWIRTNDNVVIIVPNSEFINQRVTNWTANDRQVRVAVAVGVGYGSDVKRVREVLLGIAKNHPDVLPDPSPDVLFSEFGDSSLNFELRVWTVKQVHTPALLKSDLYFSVFEEFAKQKIEIPFPQRDLHLRTVSAETLAALSPQTKRQDAA